MRFPALNRAILAVFAFWFCFSGTPANAQKSAGNPPLPVLHVDNGANSEAAQKAHYVVLVSLDGFRWDYAKRDGAEHLLALGRKGAWAPEGMMPSYPSLTR